MLQFDNTSPFKAEFLGFPNLEGVDTVHVVIKGTFILTGSEPALAEEQRPLTLVDEYWGEADDSSLRYASEVHLGKPGTDVVVVGQACAPGERPAEHVDVSVAVAGRQKSARVQGDRYWTEGLGGLGPSRPKPFVRMPLVYERTYGGKHLLDPEAETYLYEARNPVGCGFMGKRSIKEILGHPVPNIEDPRAPIGAPSSPGVPVGFGPIAPSWEPRLGFAGTYDDAWRRTRAPYLPRDFDPRFFHSAPDEFVFPEPLVGGESIAMLGLHPEGVQRFSLPRCELSIIATLAGEPEPLSFSIETLVLEPSDQRFTITWRASLPVTKQMLHVEKVAVSLERMEGASA